MLEVRNQQALEGVEPALRHAAKDRPAVLFAGVNDADLIRLGIDAEVLPLVRLLTTEAHLQALANLLPALQYDALTGLAAGMTPEQVWAEVSQHLPTGTAPEQVDTDDIAAAVARTPDRFVLVSGPDELAQILAHPFDAWRVFLHPAQRELAYRPSYTGPALVAGGAGTGKTVTALHRAVFLARSTPDAVSARQSCSPPSPGASPTHSIASSPSSPTTPTSTSASKSSTWTGWLTGSWPTRSDTNPRSPTNPVSGICGRKRPSPRVRSAPSSWSENGSRSFSPKACRNPPSTSPLADTAAAPRSRATSGYRRGRRFAR